MKINRSILPNGRIGLAVSGGADSVALAFLLTKGGKKRNAAKRFVILHVDHGIRKESKEEYRFVRALAKRLGVPFKGLHVKLEKEGGRWKVEQRNGKNSTVQRGPSAISLRSIAPFSLQPVLKGESLEMAARRVRLAFFSTCVKSLKLDAIATGHHMDDVAETFLMRIRRASGPQGLAGIKETSQVGSIKFVRPLLGCRDAELKAYLRKYDEEWREDATNDDTSIERNKVRHEVIPFLEKTLDAKLVEHIGRICKLLAAN